MKISDQGFVVTGAASGLGEAVAKHLLSQGAKVMMLDANAVILEKAKPLGANAKGLVADVTSEADINAALAKAQAQFGALRGVVNCAGIAPAQKIVGRDGAHDLELFSKVIAVNLIGTFNVMRLGAEMMSAQEPLESGERGVIVNTASIAAFEGQIGQAAYAASKGGVASLTLPAAREFARSGIRVVAIAPGIFGTPMVTNMPQEVQDALGASIPFPARLGDPAEFARLIAHVFENEMINGETIRIDGALRMGAK